MIYLDNSATTFVRPEVREAMLPYLGELDGNPSSIHAAGRKARKAIDTAREQVAALLNCAADEIYFSPCATYSNNVAIAGRARFAQANGHGKHLITSEIEHPSCLGPAKYLEANGWDVTYLPVSQDGLISAERLRKAIRPQTSIISLHWANNEIGSVFPIADFATIAHEREIYFHTDAVQVPGKMEIDLAQVPVDTLSLSGHKFYAPKGIGVLFKRNNVQVQPVVWGGGQEMSLFPGTENIAHIVGIGVAAELARTELKENPARLRAMQNILLEGLRQIPGLRFTGPQALEQRLPGHISLVLESNQGEAAVVQADMKGLCISSASACHKGIMQPSHVVSALGLDHSVCLGSLRLSAGRFNTEDECHKALSLLKGIIGSLKTAVKAAD